MNFEPDRPFGLSRGVWAVIAIALVGGLYGEVYSSLFYGEEAAPFGGFRRGFFISAISACFEILYVRSDRRAWIRRTAYWKGLVVRVFFHTFAVRFGLNANDLFDFYVLGRETAVLDDAGDELRDTFLSMGVILVFAVLTQLGPVVGGRRFLALASGRYFRPVRERRIFAFLDVVGSSAAARRLGDERFHDWLNEFFYEADPIAVRMGGEIVSYVGDGVILTWPLHRDPHRNGRALAAVLSIRARMAARNAEIAEEFGTPLRFRAAIHCGPVVVGETGETRRQITFLGDTINVTARMEALAKSLDVTILASASLLAVMPEASAWTARDVGQHAIKGIDEPLRCYSVEPLD